MNIVFLMQDTGSVYGAERATLDLAGGLQHSGHSVRILLIVEKRLAGAKGRNGLREAIVSAGLRSTLLETSGRFSWRLVQRIRGALRDCKADILHAVGYKANVHGGLASRWGKDCGLVGTVHGWLFRPDTKERFYGWVDVQAFKRFDAVIALSHYYRDMLAEAGVSDKKLHLIPSGLDLSDARLSRRLRPTTEEGGSTQVGRSLRLSRAQEGIANAPDRDHIFTFGMLGRLSWEKNYDLALRAIKMLKERGVDGLLSDSSAEYCHGRAGARPSRKMAEDVEIIREGRAPARPSLKVRLLIAGDGPLRSELEQRAAELGLSDDVEFAGYMSSDDFFATVDALIVPSRIENLPYSVLEAMAWCRPVIATRVGGLQDLVEDGVNGYLVAPNSESALAERMAELTADSKRCLELGCAGRQVLEQRFSIGTNVSAHEKLYGIVNAKTQRFAKGRRDK